jgi:HEAT repeat protein
LHALEARLEPSRPDVAKTVRDMLLRFCNHEFIVRLAQLSGAVDGRGRAAAIVAVAAPSLVPAWLELLDGQTERARARQLVPLMCDCAGSIAPAVAQRLSLLSVDAACAALTVLGAAGTGYEELIAQQVKTGEERRAREAMRALARIGTPRAAGFIARHIEDGPPVVRPAAEEALWRLPLPLAFAKTHELLRRRDFVIHHPHTAARLLERAVQSADDGLAPVLEGLTSLRFHFWSPAVARVGAKARELRQ